MISRKLSIGILAASCLGLAACDVGPSERGTFDRTLEVSGPVRIELTSASGSVRIKGTAAGKIQIHGDVSAGGFLGSAKEELSRIIGAPPIEQHGSLVRIGKGFSGFQHASISYTIEVPADTELSVVSASGSQHIQGVRGPVNIESASGEIQVENVEKTVTIKSASGSVHLANLGDDAKVKALSGSIEVNSIKGDLRAQALSGSIVVSGPGGRIETDTASGSVRVNGAMNDVRANSASGSLHIMGNPSGNSYWHLKTASGGVEVAVPKDAGFNLSAEAVSGQIEADLPIVIEDQGKHSLRARFGTPGGRVEVRTISGGIKVQPAS